MTTAKNIYKVLVNNSWNETVIATPKKISQYISDMREYHSRSGEYRSYTLETVWPVIKWNTYRLKVI